MAECASPAGMRECIQVYIGDVLLLPLLLTVRVCSVCKREGGRLKGLCLLFYELGLYVGFL